MTLREAKIEIANKVNYEDAYESVVLTKVMRILNEVDDYSKECIECGKWYTPTSPGQKFCSAICKNKHKKEKLEAKNES